VIYNDVVKQRAQRRPSVSKAFGSNWLDKFSDCVLSSAWAGVLTVYDAVLHQLRHGVVANLPLLPIHFLMGPIHGETIMELGRPQILPEPTTATGRATPGAGFSGFGEAVPKQPPQTLMRQR
jgi:hypothetical protein